MGLYRDACLSYLSLYLYLYTNIFYMCIYMHARARSVHMHTAEHICMRSAALWVGVCTGTDIRDVPQILPRVSRDLRTQLTALQRDRVTLEAQLLEERRKNQEHIARLKSSLQVIEALSSRWILCYLSGSVVFRHSVVRKGLGPPGPVRGAATRRCSTSSARVLLLSTWYGEPSESLLDGRSSLERSLLGDRLHVCFRTCLYARLRTQRTRYHSPVPRHQSFLAGCAWPTFRQRLKKGRLVGTKSELGSSEPHGRATC